MYKRRRYVFSLLAAAVAVAAVAGVAAASSRSDGSTTVLVKGKEGWESGAFVYSTFRFSPDVTYVSSGESVTFVNGTKDPHTATISTKKGLPTSFDAPCPACRVISGHLKNPRDENSGIKTYVLDKGQSGLDTVGDSLFLAPKGPHKRGTVVISAPAGTTLYYLCGIHPWMQGAIKVT